MANAEPSVSHFNRKSAEKCLHDIEALLGSDEVQLSRKPSSREAPNSISKPNAAAGMTGKVTAPRLAWLDGLRGLGAVMVYILHYQGFARPFGQMAGLESAYGLDGNYYFAALPFIRVFFSGGHLAVAIFFVISGYVLASSPLRSIHAKNTEKFFSSMESALFRRWFRLFIPVAATTFCWMASWHLLGVKSLHAREKNFRDELWNWYVQFKNFSFIYTGNQFNSYNFHVWSINLEFRGSIVVYTMLIALRRCNHHKRLLCEALLVLYFMYVVDGWYCALFMAGAFLCDLDILSEQQALPVWLNSTSRLSNWIYRILFVIAMYLGGVPSLSEDVLWLRKQPGWYWLSFIKPQAILDGRFYYRSIAAVLLVFVIPKFKFLKRFFEASFCQYLGRVSYAFYLVHGPILWSLGDRLVAASGRIADHHATTSPTWINYMALPSIGPLGLEVDFLAPHLILFPFTLWVAEVATRLFDEPSVRFAQFLMSKAFDENGSGTERKLPFRTPNSARAPYSVAVA